MKKSCLFVILTLAAAAAFGQGAPITGTAPVSLVIGTSIPGMPFTVDVHVDLTNVTGVCNTTVPAVLGGYSLPIAFTPAQATFVSAAACTDPQFSAAPTFTAPATANASGQVTIASSQVNPNAPVGNVCVARLTFQSISSGSLTVLGTGSLSSALQPCVGGGPVLIPYSGSAAAFGVGQIPTLSPLMLMLLALALAGVATLTGVMKK
ncbi:MAG TPA: hypothetical protein VHL58_06520 [Thermoanaerobaculia bacterium]|nr:hypothetical protein [Thermoanaerobaculia bacterium]